LSLGCCEWSQAFDVDIQGYMTTILKSSPEEKLQQYFEQWELKLTKLIAVQEDYFESYINYPSVCVINPLNAELNPICHLLALLGAHHILHVSRISVKCNFHVNIPGT